MLRFTHILALLCVFWIVKGSSTFKDGKVYTIKSEADGKVLTAQGKKYDSGTKISLDTSHDDSTQMWLAIEKEDNRFILVTKHQRWEWSKIIGSGGSKKKFEDLPSHTLVMTANTKSDQHGVTLEHADGKARQLWQPIKSVSDDLVLLKHVATDNCLVNPASSSKKGLFSKLSNLVKKDNHAKIKECNASDRSQMWTLTEQAN